MPINWIVALAGAVFATGGVGVLFRRNPLVMFMAAEMMWNAAALAFIAFSRSFHAMDGQVFAFLIIATAAAEVGIGLALIVATYRHRHRLDVDEIARLKG